jgi:hypothetical protein
VVVDVTVVYPLGRTPPSHPHRSGGLGSAATELADTGKHVKYDADCARLNFRLITAAFDTYGAICPAAAGMIKELARRKCSRLGIPKSIGIPREFALLNVALMRGIACLLLTNVA